MTGTATTLTAAARRRAIGRSSATESSAGRRAAAVSHGTTPKARPAGEAGDGGEPVVKQRDVAAKLVDQVAGDMRAVRLPAGSHGCRRVEAMTPPRSISPTRTTGTPAARRKAHIGDVAGAQVDLGRRAGALRPRRDRLARKPRESCRSPMPSNCGFSPGSRAPCAVASDLAVQRRSGCRSPTAASAAPGSCRRRRRRGRPAPAATAPGRSRRPPTVGIGDGGIVRHVLRLERAHAAGRGWRAARHSPATSTDLPTSEPVPCNITARAMAHA